MFLYPSRRTESVELVNQFSPEESARIETLRWQFHLYPDRFKFDINYRRLEFARWLVAHGYLGEWHDGQIEPGAGAPTKWAKG